MIDAVSGFDRFVAVYLIPVGWKVLGAVILWVLGSWAIRVI